MSKQKNPIVLLTHWSFKAICDCGITWSILTNTGDFDLQDMILGTEDTMMSRLDVVFPFSELRFSIEARDINQTGQLT